MLVLTNHTIRLHLISFELKYLLNFLLTFLPEHQCLTFLIKTLYFKLIQTKNTHGAFNLSSEKFILSGSHFIMNISQPVGLDRMGISLL